MKAYTGSERSPSSGERKNNTGHLKPGLPVHSDSVIHDYGVGFGAGFRLLSRLIWNVAG